MNATILDHGSASETAQKPKAPRKARSAKWLVAALLLLSTFPLVAGAFRLSQLAGGAAITPANARFFASPLPVVHIVSASVYAILGRSSLRTASGTAGRAGTAGLGGSWCSAACWLGFPGCG